MKLGKKMIVIVLIMTMSVSLVHNFASAQTYTRNKIKTNSKGFCDIISIKGNTIKFRYGTNDNTNDVYYKKIRTAKITKKTKFYKAINSNCVLIKSTKKAAIKYYKKKKPYGWCSFYLKKGKIINYVYGEDSYVG